MKKALTLAMALLLLLTCVACGGAGGAAPPPMDTAAPQEAPGEAYDGGFGLTTSRAEYAMNEEAAPMAEEEMDYASNVSATVSGGSVYDRADAKLIRRAALTLETLEFESAAAKLDAMVQSYDGYYEQSDIWGGAYEGALRSGYYIVRIPRAAYDSFMNAVGDVGHMMRRVETTENVGEAYYDAEIRLETLQTKHGRLLALLEKATDMESIITLQSYLSDVEYEIDYYSGTLRRYDGLVDYATIEISLEERVRLSGDPGEKTSFATQFGAAFANGLGNLGESVQSLFLWAAYHFVGLLILAVIVISGVVFTRRKLRARSLRPKHSVVPPVPPAEVAQEDSELPPD